jgi:3-deoxy-D-manno-octulosonic-acid transferase
MYFFYTAALALWLVLSAPIWLFWMLRQGKYRAGLGERLGRVPDRLRDRPPGQVIWVHAVSVGEVVAVSGLVGELRSRYPKVHVVVSTTTDTGQRLAGQRFGQENVFYFPLDFGFSIRPYLRTLQPSLVVVAETELWPNFLHLAKLSGAKISIVNARISDRSFPGYGRVKRWLKRMLHDVDLFLAQTEEDRNRLLAIGAAPERVRVAGNLKFDIDQPEVSAFVGSLRDALPSRSSAPVLVCGSTVEGEERVLLRAFEIVLGKYPDAVMVLAPRHPERFDTVAKLVESLGLRLWRQTEWRAEPLAGGVFLLDSIGELATVYSLATLAFVGGSLAQRGGHNILEAVQWGVPVVVGPHTENFRDMVELFRASDALRVAGMAELPLEFLDLLGDTDERTSLGRRALEVLRSQSGATQRTLDALGQLLPPPARSGGARSVSQQVISKVVAHKSADRP